MVIVLFSISVSDLYIYPLMERRRGDDGRLGHGDNGWKYVPRIAQSLSGQVIVQGE